MDMAQFKIEQIAQLFPQVITEVADPNGATDADGKPLLKKAIDFEKLKLILSAGSGDYVIADDEYEKYEFTWVGKKQAMVDASTPIRKTLRPCQSESKNWETTENLYIEGDNLEVLKMLQESYLGKVKMIYIDPPYNTGQDFIYKDRFKQDAEEYNEELGMYDEDGNRLFQNTEANGRFHSDWCSMIYSRLLLARNLLSDDGVIFMSIDDNEVENLKKICDEVFSRLNFINLLTVKTKLGGVSGSSEGKSLKDVTEFILIYAKDKSSLLLKPTYIKTPLFDRIRNYEIEGKSWKYVSIITKLEGKEIIKNDMTSNVIYYGYRNVETMSIASFAKNNNMSIEDVYNKYADKIFQTTNAQSSVRGRVLSETYELDFPMIGVEYKPIKGKNQGKTIEILYKGVQRRMMMFLSDSVSMIDGVYYYLDKVTSLWEDIDYNNLAKEGNVDFPNGKKPIKLLNRILNLSCNSNDIILDFFAGSSSTAHAVMQLNAEDGGNRKFIMVQLPEETDEKSDAFKAGYKNICEIGKERIRRAGDKILGEQKSGKENDLFSAPEQKLDIGFRVFKVGDTNMRDVYYSAGDIAQENLHGMLDNIKDDRSDLDLLYGCLLDWGVELTYPHSAEKIDGATVHTVDTPATDEIDLIACFDSNLPECLFRQIASRKPLRALFRDHCFADSSHKINVFEIFKALAPDTSIKVI